MCIKGPESWWIAKSITISRVVNQSKVNPQRPKGFTTREIVIDFANHQLSGPLIIPILHSKSIVDGPILHSKSVVDGSILHCKAKVCVFS